MQGPCFGLIGCEKIVYQQFMLPGSLFIWEEITTILSVLYVYLRFHLFQIGTFEEFLFLNEIPGRIQKRNLVDRRIIVLLEWLIVCLVI